MTKKTKKFRLRVSLASKSNSLSLRGESDEALAAIIRFDPRTIFETGEILKRPQDLSPEQRMAIADMHVDPTSGRIRLAEFKNKVDAAEEYFRRQGKGDDPKIVEMIKQARRAKERASEVFEAMLKIRETDESGTLN